MIKRESKSSGLSLMWLAAVMLAVVFVVPALAQEEPPLDEELQMAGTIEGTGTYFEITDSEYLNIVFQSSEPVHLTLESVPQMVVMHIEAAEGATSWPRSPCRSSLAVRLCALDHLLQVRGRLPQ